MGLVVPDIYRENGVHRHRDRRGIQQRNRAYAPEPQLHQRRQDHKLPFGRQISRKTASNGSLSPCQSVHSKRIIVRFASSARPIAPIGVPATKGLTFQTRREPLNRLEPFQEDERIDRKDLKWSRWSHPSVPLERMPIIETPTKVDEPNEPAGNRPEASGAAPDPSSSEEEARLQSRRTAFALGRLRYPRTAGNDQRPRRRAPLGPPARRHLSALLFHILLLSALTWIPRYVFKVPPVIDPFDAIKQRKDLSYLDLPPDLLREAPAQGRRSRPVPDKRPQIDKKTLKAMNKPTPPPVQAADAPQARTAGASRSRNHSRRSQGGVAR